MGLALELEGNLHRLFNDGWDYKFDLLAKYGGVIKIYGMLGVRLCSVILYRIESDLNATIDDARRSSCWSRIPELCTTSWSKSKMCTKKQTCS